MPIRVEYTPVTSNNLKAIGHVEGHGLFVDFQSGKRYVYPDVPAEVFDALLSESRRASGSVGKAFHRLVKAPGYDFEEIETR